MENAVRLKKYLDFVIGLALINFYGCGKKIEQNNPQKKITSTIVNDSPSENQGDPQARDKELLYNAILADDINLIESVIKSFTHLDFKFKNAETPLTLAIQFSKNESIDKILTKTSKVNDANAIGLSPMHLAVKENKLRTIEALYERGANLESLDLKGFTPLAYSVKYAREPMITKLLTFGANDKTKLHDDSSSMLDQLRFLNFQEALRLLKLIKTHQKPSEKQFFWAVENANINFTNYLLHNYSYYKKLISKVNVINLALFIENPNLRLQMLNLLLSNGADPNSLSDGHPLILATKLGQYESVETLINYQANIFAKDELGLNIIDYSSKNLRSDILIQVFGPIKKKLSAMSESESESIQALFQNACQHIPEDDLEDYGVRENILRKKRIKVFLNCSEN